MTPNEERIERAIIANRVKGVVAARTALEGVSVHGFTPEESEQYIAARKAMLELEHLLELRHAQARLT